MSYIYILYLNNLMYKRSLKNYPKCVLKYNSAVCYTFKIQTIRKIN